MISSWAGEEQLALWFRATSPASQRYLESMTWGTCLWSCPARSYWRGRLLVTRDLSALSESETTLWKKHPFLFSYLEHGLCWISTRRFRIHDCCWCGLKGPGAAEAVGKCAGDRLQHLVCCQRTSRCYLADLGCLQPHRCLVRARRCPLCQPTPHVEGVDMCAQVCPTHTAEGLW